MNLVAALHSDPNAIVLGDALRDIATIEDRIAATGEERAALQAWERKQFGPVYKALGAATTDESQDKKQLRALLFLTLGAAKDPAVVAEARTLAERISPTRMRSTRRWPRRRWRSLRATATRHCTTRCWR